MDKVKNMDLLECSEYIEDLNNVIKQGIDWESFRGKTFMISGATGMIGTFLIDVLMRLNAEKQLGCSIVALGRNPKKAQLRFSRYWEDDLFSFHECDISREINCDLKKVDYVLHFASNTHPRAYSTDPIGTVTANVIGTYQLLEFAASHDAERFLFASSVEIYGENRGDIKAFTEDYCGYINCNTLRAGYPESKRSGEALCQAFIKQKGLDVVIPRLPRTYGPTLLPTDSKALSQFLQRGIAGEDIVLKSEGKQFFSYSYVADTVSGIFWCLIYGLCGEAYNISDTGSDISLRDLAGLIADECGTKVVFDLPDEVERQGYSTATVAIMDSTKLQGLNWKAHYDIKSGIERTIRMLKASASNGNLFDRERT